MKTLKIKIRDRKKVESDLVKLARELDKGQFRKKSKKNDIFFESLSAVRKILTDNRLDVWRTIRDKRPDSITHLAQLLHRGFRSVHRDVMLLRDLGLIELIEGPGKRGHVQQLVSLYDELSLVVA
jgi:predicted transcriptional regulator